MNIFTNRALDCAALHTGKDLAVSPLALPRELFPNVHSGIPSDFRLWTSLLAPLQLLATGVTRYLALGLRLGVFGLSSPTLANRGDHHAIILYNTLQIIATTLPQRFCTSCNMVDFAKASGSFNNIGGRSGRSE